MDIKGKIKKALMILMHSLFMLPAAPRGGAGSLTVEFRCPEAIFAFGDSLTDTGNDAAAFPRTRSTANYGQTYFHKFAGRASDGRLMVDFMAQAFGFPLPSPYLQNVKSDYRHGANFAVRGATARSTSIVTPFFLDIQVSQLITFKENVLETLLASPDGALGKSALPTTTTFSSALYVIFIGINDFWQNFHNNHMTIDQVNATVIPETLQAVSKAMQDLYTEGGARSFMVVNVPAIGCLPMILSAFGTGVPKDYDRNGCLQAYNQVVQLYNSKLHAYVQDFQQKFSDAHVIHADYFKLHRDVIADPVKYGFGGSTKLTACCGGGGIYQQPVKQCGVSSTAVCAIPASYISWDGIHFTDAFSKLVATSFLTSGQYLDPPLNLSKTCLLPSDNLL